MEQHQQALGAQWRVRQLQDLQVASTASHAQDFGGAGQYPEKVRTARRPVHETQRYSCLSLGVVYIVRGDVYGRM